MSRVTALLDYLRGQSPGPDEPDEMDAVQPVDPATTHIVSQSEWDELQHQMMHEHYCDAHVCPVCGKGGTDYLEPPAPVTIRRGRTYDEPVEGM